MRGAPPEPAITLTFNPFCSSSADTDAEPPVAAELVRRLGPLLGLEPRTEEKLPVFAARYQPRVESAADDGIKLVANK